MPSLNSSQKPHSPDGSSSKFRDQLRGALCQGEYRQWAQNLHGEDLMRLVDCLDKALNNLDPTGSRFSACLRELGCICGAKMTLPTSFPHSPPPAGIGRRPVASGSSCDLYEATLDGSKVCVKRVRVRSEDDPGKAIQTLYQEAVVWKYLQHRNIVPLLGVISTPVQSLQLISEWMPGGVLTDYIKSHPIADRFSLLYDVAQGLHFLHSRNVVHGDLKGPNILVDSTGHARITDFGQAAVIQDRDHIRGAPGDLGHNIRWTALEILKEEGTHSKEVDVFSLAMAVIEVFTGVIPFSNSRPAVTTMTMVNDACPSRPTHPALTDQLWTLVQRCWARDPRLCPKVSEVLEVLPPSDHTDWELLIVNPLSAGERIPLVDRIFSDPTTTEAVESLRR